MRLRYFSRGFSHNGLSFAASGLSMRAEYAPSAAKHSYSYAFCLQERPGIACPAPAIRKLMKNAGLGR